MPRSTHKQGRGRGGHTGIGSVPVGSGPAGTGTVSVSRPVRSTVPGRASVGSPSRTIVVPFTNTCGTPIGRREQTRGAAGQVVDQLHVAGRDRLGIEAHEVGVVALGDHAAVAQAEQLRRRSVISCTARSSDTSCRPRRQSARNPVVYGAPHMRSRWAPASEPPISTSRVVPRLGRASASSRRRRRRAAATAPCAGRR